MKFSSLAALLFAFAACTDDGNGAGAGSAELAGSATYRDAETDHAGNPREPEAPPAQSADVFITVKGTGQIPQVDPQCATDALGAFEARYTGTATLTADEGYVAAFAENSARIVTPSGCEIPELTVGAVTDVVVRAELEATTQNCESYCEANGRAEAEAQCGASPAAAQCRGAAEAELTSQCTTTCTSQRDKIVAEVSIGASALGSLDANALRAAALGELSANLTFDRME